MTTSYHAQYWAYALTLRGATDAVDSLSRAISNARVDLNPHQVDAALFAVRSPLSKGVILADEVGLGKTIEAALVLSQRWAERRRHLLIIVPASLRKQWQQELDEKFFLPSVVLEKSAWKRLQSEGHPNPFDLGDRLVICSYHFAAQYQSEVGRVPWDLVVMDEAHRLRNVYKAGAKTARAVVAGVEGRQKLLLTATPLQNSLMELYGLVSVVDPHIFGDPLSFREQFLRLPDEQGRNRLLQLRLKDICQRTLRRQVLEYVRFTQRIPVTQAFFPSDHEQQLYEEVSEYLRRDHLYALPNGQRTLMTMVLRKLLASSSFAIGNTLNVLIQRLLGLQNDIPLTEQLRQDIDTVDELADELEEEEDDKADKIDPIALSEEIQKLQSYLEMARQIQENAKGDALVKALASAFERAVRVGAPRKAVVFTESRRTQEYLYDLLKTQGYEGRVVMLNGSNNDAESGRILNAWRARHTEDGLSLSARAVEVKAAITETFRDQAEILLATEAAAEGVNLQFCSLVVNYDLPWNPQRVEQRIGRCHRYGQKHDVVVVNFLNQRNAADLRVFQLLSEKFKLFDGVFGASDEILGALESGVDIERRVAEVYQTCRTPEEITAAFDKLQTELEERIKAQMAQTRQAILDHFDEDVQARLRVHRDEAQSSLDQRGRWLLNLTRFELNRQARFDVAVPRFQYQGAGYRRGWYHLDWREAERLGDSFYRVDHPLAANLVEQAKGRNLPVRRLNFAYRGQGVNIAALEPFVGASGWLSLGLLTVNSLDTEEFLVFAGQADDGRVLEGELCLRLFGLEAQEGAVLGQGADLRPQLQMELRRCIEQVEARNARHFDAEVVKLDRWSDDLKIGLEREIKEIDGEIRETRKKAALALLLADKLAAQREIKTLEQKRNHKRRDLFEEQDRIDTERAALISGIEAQLAATQNYQPLFSICWALS